MRIEQLVHRILARLIRFTQTSEAPDDLDAQGPVLGIYDSGQAAERLVVTSSGVYIRDSDGWKLISFVDIASVESDSDKANASWVDLHLTSGQCVRLHVTGGTGRFRDVYEIARFLARASARH